MIERVEIYSNDMDERVPPKFAVKRMVYILDGLEIKERYTEYGEWSDDYDSHVKLFFDDDVSTESDDNIEWITVKGNHIPIKKGQDKGDAIADFFDKKNKTKPKYNKDFGKGKPTKNKTNVVNQIKKQYPQMDESFIKSQLDRSDVLRGKAVKSNEYLKRELGTNKNVRISGRIKESESMVGKLARQPENFKTVDDLHDISGVRATADTIRDVQNTMDYVRNNYNVLEEKNNIDEDRDGYRSYHAIIEKDGIKHEIQIRTKNQDKWANYAHDNFYKPATKQQSVFIERNKDIINEYTKSMSDYFYNMDMGKNSKKPDCPQKISIVVGCL